MGQVINSAFDLLERDCPSATLITPPGAVWYNNHEFKMNSTLSPVKHFSKGVVGVAARIANLYQRCPKGFEVGAMLRIAQEIWFRRPPHLLEERCFKFLSKLNHLANLMQPRQEQTCRHVIATDFFVNADGSLPYRHRLGLNRCINSLSAYENSSLWMRIGAPEIEYGVAADPAMSDVWRKDKAGFYAIVELAMLARADVCIESSHMAHFIVNLMRMSLGKTSCHHLGGQLEPGLFKRMTLLP